MCLAVVGQGRERRWCRRRGRRLRCADLSAQPFTHFTKSIWFATVSDVPHRRSRIIPAKPGVDIERVLQRLRTPAHLPVESQEDMASEVHVLAEKKPRPKGSISYLKAPTPVTVDSPLTTSPADILRELGAATTFVHQSRFLPVAQLWAHVRYCATMRATSRGLLALSPDAAKSVVHHHKVAQSEQLGIGLALVVARAVLRERHPNLDYHVVDADVALKAGYIRGMPGEVRNRPATKKSGQTISWSALTGELRALQSM